MATNSRERKNVSSGIGSRWGARSALVAIAAVLLALIIQCSVPGIASAAGDPTIFSVTPDSGPCSGGTVVKIYGDGFTSGMTVTFGGVAADHVFFHRSSLIYAISPAHTAGTVQVKVGNSADTPNDDFKYDDSLHSLETFNLESIHEFATLLDYYGRGSPSLSYLSESADRLAWDAYDGKVWHVYTWDRTSGKQDLSVGDKSNVHPVVSGNRVIWGAGNQLFTWTPTGGTVRLTEAAQRGDGYDVDGDRVVWIGQDPTTGNSTGIFQWTPETGVTEITSGAVYYRCPCVSGDRVAWWDGNGSSAGEIMTWTSAGARRVASTPYTGGVFLGYIDVSGDRLLWGGGWANDVYTWTVGAAAPQKLNTTSEADEAALDGDRVVWTDGGYFNPVGSRAHVYTWTPTGGTDVLDVDGFVDYVAVSGDRLVWESSVTGSNYSDDADIYTWTSGTGITKASLDKRGYRGWCYSPCVSGDHITWMQRYGSVTSVVSAMPQPTVNSITSNYGTPAAGNTITINGTGFSGVTGASGVTFGGVNATSYTVDSSTKITAVVPAHVAGTVEVVVTGTEGSSPTDGPWNDYVYAGTPTITSVTPSRGTLTGGTTVTINGTGFYGMSGASAVTFGGTNAASYTVDSPTKITAKTPAHALGAVNVAVTAVGGTSDSSGSTDNYEYTLPRYEQTLSSLGYLGGWTTYANAVHSGGSYKYTNAKGSSVTIAFNGTRLDWITAKGPMFGIADVVVDGRAATQVDLYDPAVKYQQKVCSTGALSAGPHTVTISCKGAKNASATNTYIGIDAVETDGSLSVVSYVEQRDARVLYQGTWSAYANNALSGGSFFFSKSPGARIVVRFTGQRLAWIATKGPIYGKAKVCIDGGTAVTVDLYAASAMYQQVAYMTGNLTNGAHTVTISYTGTKNPSSTGTYMNADAFQAVGTFTSATR